MRGLKDKSFKWLLKLGVSLASAIIVILITQDILFTITPLQELELKFLDARFLERGPVDIKDSADVIIIEITQDTYNEIPPPENSWPWPRYIFAKLINNLLDAGVKAIGIDLIMSEPDRFSEYNDSLLVKTIRDAQNVIVAGKIETVDHSFQLTQTNEDVQAQVKSGGYQVKRLDENYSSIFFHADRSIGIVQVPTDNDGVVRRYIPFVYSASSEMRVPSFGFAVLNKYFGHENFLTVENTEDYFILGNIKIPKYDRTTMLINFYGADRTFPHYKFIDIIDDSEFKTVSEIDYEVDLDIWDDPDTGLLYTDIFKDKIVLIGSTMAQDKDMFSVSMAKGQRAGDNILYGVEIHANVIQSIIDENFLYKQPKWQEIFIIIFLNIFIFYISSKIKEIKFRYTIVLEGINIILVIGIVYLIYYLSFYYFSNNSYVLPIISPMLAIVIGYFSSTAYNFIMERRQNAVIKGMFSQYVSGDLVNELISNPENLQLGGNRKNLTVLFSDIAGFSTFSEKKEPEDLVKFLNEYLSAMTDIVLQNRGTLDKYVGDAVMAFWGAPIDDENHALHGCKTAILMQKKLDEMRVRWKKENQPEIIVRIGLNSGDMVVGNIGGDQRFDYTVMGDNVNLASRLEGANKEYGTLIMIAESTYEEIKDQIIARELDLIVVKGKTLPIKVYELISLKEDSIDKNFMECCNLYHDGLNFYRERKFDEAIDKFKKAVEIHPEDYPSKMYLKRCQELKQNPPDENWDGVFIMKTK